MLIDRAKIFAAAGAGGKGCESFYQRKFMRHRRPDGGDGGKGGDVIIRTDRNVLTLRDFQYRRHFKAGDGGHGGSRLKKGKTGEDVIIPVPPGTIVRDYETGAILADLDRDAQQLIAARGGKGGTGNRTKRSAAAGQAGEKRHIALELKLIADVGFVGCPNAGKSSLLNLISGAHSKTAAFPFTTLEPVLGAVNLPGTGFICADIPGLTADAHKGKGLGMKFLRHIERTKLLLFLIDMSGIDGRHPWEDYAALRKEIRHYDAALLKKPAVIAANKMDLPPAKKNLVRFKQEIGGEIVPISCRQNKGIETLLACLSAKLSASENDSGIH